MTRFLSRSALAAVVAFLLLPLIVILPLSLTPTRYLAFPKGELSLRHYATLLSDPAWLGSGVESLLAALGTAVACTVLAVAFAAGLWIWNSRWSPVLIAVALAPLIAPQVVSAMAVYFLEARLGVLDSRAGVILGHFVIAIPYAVLTMLVAFSRLDRSLERASRSLGAGMGTTFWLVILPNVRFGVLSAAFLAFVISWDEVVVTLFITGIDTVTLPKRIWDGLRYDINPVIAAVSVLMTLVTLAILGLRALRGGERSP